MPGGPNSSSPTLGGATGSHAKHERDADPQELLATLEGHAGYVTCLAVAEGALFSGSQDNTVKKWSARTGAVVGFEILGHSCPHHSVQ